MINKLSSSLAALLLVFAFVAFSCSSPFQNRKIPSGTEQHLAEDLLAILNAPELEPMTIGVKIVSAVTGRTLFSQRSHQLFHPASNMKLFTAVGVLRTMGADYRYLTNVFAEENAYMRGDTLFTSLYLFGHGDPLLDSESLDQIASTISNNYGRVIKGDIFVDESYMDKIPFGKGWMWDDVQYSYAAPLNALSVNGNSVKILISPGASVGAPATVRVDPPTAAVTFDIQAVTAAPTSLAETSIIETLSVERAWRSRSNKIKVTGRIFLGTGEKEFHRSIEEPGLFTGGLFRDRLHARGVRVTGKVRRGTTPTRAQILVTYQSSPMAMALAYMLKESSNLAAELFLKTMGQYVTGDIGTAMGGLAVLRQNLKDYIDLEDDQYRFEDGSGLSMYNYVSPDQIVDLLLTVSHDNSISYAFREALPVAGVDGSLKHRMKATMATGNLRAKTGTLSGTSCLSGYVQTRDGETLAFSIMMNNFIGTPSIARRTQDKIGVLLANFSRK